MLDGLGHFVFENEEGTSDLRSSQEIGQLFAGSDVQCAFISGCQTGQAPQVAALGGVCQRLVGEGVPMAIGWAASITDDVANQLARTFYGTVAAGGSCGACTACSAAGLLAPERLSADERRAAHRAAGDFLVELEAQDREGELEAQGREAELSLSRVECLLEARAQYLAAEVHARAREVTDRISAFYLGQGLYGELERLNREIAEHEEHPRPLIWIARSHVDRGNYGEAREWYGRALQVAEGDEKQAAAVWHGVASIDLKEGDYQAARDKFGTSLQIGDRAGEAVTFYQLGFLAAKQGRLAQGARLIALCYLIDQAIGHGDTESDLRELAGMAAQLNYSPEQLAAMLEEGAESYQADRGKALLAAAFEGE